MIEIVSDINLKDWELLVEASDVSTFFQTPLCYNFYNGLSFLTPFKFGVKENHR